MLIFRFFPAAGRRYIDGKLYSRGQQGHYFTSSAYNADRPWALEYSATYVIIGNPMRTDGFTVRCVAHED